MGYLICYYRKLLTEFSDPDLPLYKKTVGKGRTLTWVANADYMTHHFQNAQDMGLADYTSWEPVNKWLDTTLLSPCGAVDFDQFIKDKVDPIFPLTMSYADWKAKALSVDKQV